ncbi:MAG: Cyclase [Acidimicrobiales bacterium]|nr:Cyclase [Acidimicrobiales bacterium]
MSDQPSPALQAPDLPTTAELDRIFEAVKNWTTWGADDERGALNHLTDAHRAHAATLVRTGEAVSMAHDLTTRPTPETPSPAHHHMLSSGDALGSSGVPDYEATQDYLGTAVHGLGLTHIDALCHMFVRGEMYGGRPASMVRSTGALANTIMSASEGVLGRGVLLDIPLVRGVDFIDPTSSITVADLEAAEAAQGVTVGTGDLLIVSTGRDSRKAASNGRLDPFFKGLPGLHPRTLPWLHERKVALLAGDGISDQMPFTAIPEWPFPVHQIGIVAIGLHLIDNLRLDTVTEVCRRLHRWEFLMSVSPMRVPGGTGSPVNPIAVF